jgi:hypothetical protein
VQWQTLYSELIQSHSQNCKYVRWGGVYSKVGIRINLSRLSLRSHLGQRAPRDVADIFRVSGANTYIDQHTTTTRDRPGNSVSPRRITFFAAACAGQTIFTARCTRFPRRSRRVVLSYFVSPSVSDRFLFPGAPTIKQFCSACFPLR